MEGAWKGRHKLNAIDDLILLRLRVLRRLRRESGDTSPRFSVRVP
eukprot:gene12196-biopygen5052